MARATNREATGEEVGAESAGEDLDDELPRPPGTAEMLLALMRLDLETAAAYQVIANEVGREEIRGQLFEFRDDHLGHAEELRGLLKARGTGGLPDQQDAGGAGSLLRPLAELVRPLGSAFAIVTLIANEHVTNAAYEAALEYDWNDDELDLLDRAFLDEQDHLEWLLAQETALMGEPADEGDEVQEARPRPDAPA